MKILNVNQKNKIKKNLSWTKLIFFFLWIIIFSGINIYFNDLITLWFSFLNYENYIKIPYIFFGVVNLFLIWLSINLLIDKMKEIKTINPKIWFFSFIWTFFALLSWACPWCIAGIFPVFVGIFGSNITMYNLPFHWTELQVLSFVFLIIWIYYLSKDMICKIKQPKMKNKYKSNLIGIIILGISWIGIAGYLTYNAFLLKSQALVFGWINELGFACDINSTFSCSSVFNESFAWIFWLPFSAIALIVYPIIIIIALLAILWKIKNHFKLLLIIAIWGILFNWYIIINEYIAGVYCLLCILCTVLIITVWILSIIWLKKDKQ